MSQSCISGSNKRFVKHVDVNKSAKQPGRGGVGIEAKDAWEFVNLSTPKDAKDAIVRKIVRVNAAKGLPSRTRTKERVRRPHLAAPVKPQTVLSEQPGITMANATVPHQEFSPFPRHSPRWPNQFEQLILEAELLSKPSTPSTSHQNIENDDTTFEPYARLFSYLLSPITKPDCSLGSGFADPFDAFPYKHCSQDYELLSYFCNVLAPICLPMDRRNGVDTNPLRTVWVPLMMNDVLLFHATATAMAVHLDVLHGRKEHPQTIMRKAQTIKIINERLKCKETASSNLMIGAVAMLAGAARHLGRIEESRIHEEAIRRMVDIRGGPRRLNSGVLLMLLNWGDYITSTMLGCRPQLEDCFCDDLFGEEEIYANMPALAAPLHATPLASLSCIYHQLRYLTDRMMQARSRRNKISDHDMRGFIRARSTIERSLLSLAPMNPTKPGRNVGRTDYAFEAHRVSALMYLNIILREGNPAGAMLRALHRQLHNSIKEAERTHESTYRLRNIPTALWVYTMGGLLSLEEVERQWFATRIKKTMETMDIANEADVEVVLRQAVWVDSLKTKTKTWEKLWEQVQGFQDNMTYAVGNRNG